MESDTNYSEMLLLITKWSLTPITLPITLMESDPNYSPCFFLFCFAFFGPFFSF